MNKEDDDGFEPPNPIVFGVHQGDGRRYEADEIKKLANGTWDQGYAEDVLCTLKSGSQCYPFRLCPIGGVTYKHDDDGSTKIVM